MHAIADARALPMALHIYVPSCVRVLACPQPSSSQRISNTACTMPPSATKRTAASPSRSRRRPANMPPGLGYTPRGPATPVSDKKDRSPPSTEKSTFAASDGALPCMVYVVLYHAIVIVALVAWHMRKHGAFNATQALLAIFLTINAWICVCEIALLCYSGLIQKQFAAFSMRSGDHVLPSPVFLFERVRLADVLSVRYWAIMWSTYSTLDVAYSMTHSFGFCIDVGNGVSMLLPTLALAYGMTAQAEFLSARLLGMLGLIAFYQMLYGTVVYFFQYCFNKRYIGTPRAHVIGAVVIPNGIWLVFPALGMWASSRLIMDGSYAVFL